MEVLPIGSITVFTNVSERQKPLFDANAYEEVSEALAHWVERDLEEKDLNNSIIVMEFETRIGCVITPILLGIVIAKAAAASGAATVGTAITIAGVSGAGYKFITDYDKLKKGNDILV
jgi:hypothetical protein